MSVATPIRFEFRCSSCYQSLLADSEDTGQQMDCQWCGSAVTVPEATPEGIQRAQAHEQGELALGGWKVVDDQAELSADDRAKLAKQLARDQIKQIGSVCKNPAARSASRTARLFAFIVDSMVTTVVCYLCLKAAMSSYPIQVSDVILRPSTVPMGFWVMAHGIPALMTLFYWYTISAHGKTVGKYLLKVRIVDASGTAPGFVRGVAIRHLIAAVTTIVPWIPILHYTGAWPEELTFSTRAGYDIACIVCLAVALADVFAIFLEPPRCLHDRLAGTYVVDD